MSSNADAKFLDIKAGTSFVKIEAETAYKLVQGEISWREAVATEILLDPNTKNQYPFDEFDFADSHSFSMQKTTLDQLGFDDSHIVALQKALADTVSFADTVTLSFITVDRRLTLSVSLRRQAFRLVNRLPTRLVLPTRHQAI